MIRPTIVFEDMDIEEEEARVGRFLASKYLVELAKSVEAGAVLGFEIKWSGKAKVDSTITCAAPMHVTTYEFTEPKEPA